MASLSTKPVVLLIEASQRAIDPAQWARITSRFTILPYDCSSADDFVSRCTPGGPYSNISAIVRTGWHKTGPYFRHALFKKEIIDAYPPSLKLIVNSGHGYDFFDVDALTRKGVWFCNTPDACTEAVANTAIYLILGAYRYFTYAEHTARTSNWPASFKLGDVAVDPLGQGLGIVGMGDIGLSIARKAAAGLGMRVHYYNRKRRLAEEEESVQGGAIYHSTLDGLLAAVDCICLACPLTETTRHMLSTKQFALAAAGKPGIRLVNIARGPLVDEESLLAAMDEGKVVGVGLDVHEDEPNVHPRLKEDYMVTVLPHVGVCSRTSWANFEKVCFDNLEAFFYEEKGRPLNPVNQIGGD